MLKLSDLALRPDLQLGPMLVSPSRRLLEGPGGHAHVEPLIMQVFLLLIDAGGKVVTRTELFDQCWGGVMVGDDSLNRAIAKVRRTGAQVVPGLFEIETIPRTGYRLTGEILQLLGQPTSALGEAGTSQGMPRRLLIGGGLATAAGLVGLGFWSIRSRGDRKFNELMSLGQQAADSADPAANSAQYFRQAIAIRPGDAKAQGLLALSQAMRAEFGNEDQAAAALQESERAVRAAFELDPNEPNARVAAVVLERSTLDLAATEDQLLNILSRAPENIPAMRSLWGLFQCVGRSRDALTLIERAIALKPLAAGNHYPLAQLLWILGRLAEADRVIDKAMQYWPTHQYVRGARFTIFAYTGRARAALAMLERQETAPQNLSSEAVSLWRVSLAAMDQRSPSSIAAARRTNLEAAKQNLRLASQAVMTLSVLGEIDAAFEIANALFVVRPPERRYAQAATNRSPARSTAWRFAPWLFTPPTTPMRADPRFEAICNEIGLSDYWAKRRIRPDYEIYG